MRRCDKKTQVDLPPTIIMLGNDPRKVTLRKDLAQAQQTIEKLSEQTVPREKYEKLQQQLKDINASEAQAFEGWRKVEERVTKVLGPHIVPF